MSHIWISHTPHMKESCPTEWVMSHMWMSHVAHMNQSCLADKWVTSHIWMSHVPHVNKSCPTCEFVMSHMWMNRVTHMNQSRLAHEWVTSHIWMSHVPCTSELYTFSPKKNRQDTILSKKNLLKNLLLASQHRTDILLVTRFRPAHFYFGHAHFDRIEPGYRDIQVEIYTWILARFRPAFLFRAWPFW